VTLYILRRLVQLIPVLFLASFIVFFIIHLIPGDAVEIMLGESAAPAQQVETMRHDMGLDRPPVERFGVFLRNALTGDFGLSFFHRRPVSDVIAERLPATIELTLAALLLALAISIPLGVAAAVKKNSLVDRLAALGSLFGTSLPGFWFGIVLIILFAVEFKLLPVSGRLNFACEVPPVTYLMTIDSLLRGRPDCFADAVSHLVLPAVTLALPMAAVLTRVQRAAMVEVLRSDYIVFAEAKGISRRRILWRHALKNALVPTVTVAGDSVILTVTIAEDIGAQPVTVDSFVVKSGINVFGADVPVRVARAASGPTAVRFAWSKAQVWAPNSSHGGTITVSARYIAPGECGTGVCWGPDSQTAAWTYFRDATAPVAVPASAVTWTAGLN